MLYIIVIASAYNSTIRMYIYIYAFSRRFYPKLLTVHSGYTCFISMCVPWELNPQHVALLGNETLHRDATGNAISDVQL